MKRLAISAEQKLRAKSGSTNYFKLNVAQRKKIGMLELISKRTVFEGSEAILQKSQC